MIEFLKGFFAFFMASRFLQQNNMLKWYLLPILLWLALFFGIAFSVSDGVEAALLYWFDAWLGLPIEPAAAGHSSWLVSLKAFFSLSVAVLIKILVWLLVGRITKYFILIMLAPLMAYLSEKAECLVNGRVYGFSLQQTMVDAGRGALVSLRNLALEMAFWLLAFVISLALPILALPAMLFMFVVSAWFMGFNMFYYLLERQKRTIAETITQTGQYRARVLGLGVAYNLVSLLPLLDWVIAPINGPVGAVIAARKTSLFPE